MKYLNEEFRKTKAEEWLRSLEVLKKSEDKVEARTDELPDSSLRMLVKADGEPAKTLTQMYKELGLSAEEGLKTKEDLQARGYVRERAMARKGSGAQIKVLEVLQRGQVELRVRGYVPHPKIVGRGRDWKHTIGYPAWIKRWCEERGYQVWFEKKIGEKDFDAVYASDGKIFGIEICLSGDAEYNSQAAEKAAMVHGIEHVFMGFEDLSLKGKVKIKLKEKTAYIQKKVSCISLGEFAPVEPSARKERKGAGRSY